jgi:hypothetical protein
MEHDPHMHLCGVDLDQFMHEQVNVPSREMKK